LRGPIPASIGNLLVLQILYLNRNHISGKIPSEIGKLKKLLKLDLSSNNFSDSIPPEIGNCILLTYVDLSENQLSGPIPSQISQIHVLNYLNLSWNHLNQSLPKIGSLNALTSADFSHNNFCRLIPQNGQYLFFNYTSFVGNPFLFRSHPINHHPGKFRLILALGILSCLLVSAILIIIRTRKSRNNTTSWKLTAFQKLNFKSKDIIACINEGNIIGKVGAGVIYKGIMPNGEQVTVKKLLGPSKGGVHDHGLSAEIKTLGKIRHRNIVRLMAFWHFAPTKKLICSFTSTCLMEA